MKSILKKFFSGLINSFSSRSLVLQILGFVFTYLIVISGFDLIYFKFFDTPLFQALLFPAVIVGSLGVFVFILSLLLYGLIKKNKKILNFSIALSTAAITGLVISMFYKAFTGRGHPTRLGQVIDPTTVDFHFGFLKGGVFWGWPSSHTTVAFAVGITIFLLYKHNKLRYLALLIAFYIGIGISTNIHWFSDFVAGALIGTAIGLSVYKNYNLLYDRS